MPADLSALDDQVTRFILPVYRYHLALRGDHTAATTLTISTLYSAQTWLDTYRSEPGQDRLAVWIFSIARYKQAFTARRGQSSENISSVHSFDKFTENPDPISEAVHLWQAQLSWLSDDLRWLPPIQSEALALVCFGGLSQAEVAALLHAKPNRIHQLLDNPLASPIQLTALANQINLSESDLELILKETTSKLVPHPAWLHRNLWPQAFELRSFINRIVPAIGLATLLVLVFVIVSRPVTHIYQIFSATGQPVFPINNTLYNLSSAAPRQIQSGPGYLVPPDPTECPYWQRFLMKALSQQAALIEIVPFQNPLASGPSEHGTGCELDLSGTTADPTQVHTFLQMIQPFFTQQDYSVSEFNDCSTLLSDNTWPCQGRLFYLQTYSRAILTISQPALVAASSPCAVCPSKSYVSQFKLRMQLASNPTQPIVDNFLSRWKVGDDLARNDFTSQLLNTLPDLSELDKLAGIDRSPAGGPDFSVQIIQNTGTQLLVKVQVEEIRPPPLPSKSISTLQLKLVRLNRGWKIQQISVNPASTSPPT
ncbi:MAG TPA: hypothetical protein VKF38_11705 [Anaerolineaceae bacterium]|nr:hypothetical protein [Anaerolineaceae bacterium]